MTTADAAGVTRAPIPRRAWKALAVSGLGYSLMSFNTTATNLAFGRISDTFSSARPTTLSWVASVFFIGLASLLPVSGRLADRVGRRRVFRIGLGIFAVGSLLSAFAPFAAFLIGARFVTAIGGALILPSSLAAVLPEFPKERHYTAVAVWAACGPIASAAAPALSAFVLAVTSWRVLFALSTPIALLALVGGWRAIGESSADGPHGRLDWAGVVVGTAAIASMVFAAGQGPALGWTAPAVLGAYVGIVVLTPLFLIRCARHPEPLLNLAVFRIRPVWVANLANFVLNLAGMGTWLVWPLWFARVWDYDAVQTGFALMPGPVLSGILTTLGGRVAEKRGHETIVRTGAVVTVVAMALPIVTLSAVPNYLTGAFAACALAGGGWAMTQPPLNSGVLSRVGADYYAEVNASFNTVRNISGALGVAIAIAIIGDADRPDVLAAYDRVWWTFFGVAVTLAVIVFVLYPRSAGRQGAARGRP